MQDSLRFQLLLLLNPIRATATSGPDLVKKRIILINKMKETKHTNYQEDRPRDHRNHDSRWHNEHRHKRNSFFRAGQIFSILYHLSSFALAYLLVKEGEQTLAFKLLLLNAGLVIFALLLAAIERRFNSSRYSNRGGRNNSRPQNRRPNPRLSARA